MRDTRRTRVVLGAAAARLVHPDHARPARRQQPPVRALRSASRPVFGPVEQRSAVGDRPDRATSSAGRRTTTSDDARPAAGGERRAARAARTTDDAQPRAAELDDLLKVAGLGRYTDRAGPGDRDRRRRRASPGPSRSTPGAATGSTPDMTVINGDGLVGRVKYVTREHGDRAAARSTRSPRSACGSRAPGRSGYVTGAGHRRRCSSTCELAATSSSPATGW